MNVNILVIVNVQDRLNLKNSKLRKRVLQPLERSPGNTPEVDRTTNSPQCNQGHECSIVKFNTFLGLIYGEIKNTNKNSLPKI